MKEISLETLRAKAQNIKYFFTDVDGTLTDGCVYYSSCGEALKKFSLRDGTGNFLLRKVGILSGIITGEDSPIVAKRAEKLKVDVLLMNAVPKVDTLRRFIAENDLSFENIAYIGDDFNDVKLMRLCGLSFAVGDSSPLVSEAADIVCHKYGGEGAFREAVEMLLSLKGLQLETLIEKVL